MKLAFINNLYPPYIIGGNEMLAKEVIEALRARGHPVHIITGRGRDLPHDGLTHGAIDLDLDHKEDTFLHGKKPTPLEQVEFHLYNHRTYRSVRSVLLELKPDLIVIWNLWVASMAPLIAARQSGFPLVIHTADKWLYYGLKDWSHLVAPQTEWKVKVVQLMRRYVQPMLFHLARPYPIISISEFIRRFYITTGFDGSRIEVIHLGVPLEKFHPNGRSQPSQSRVRFLYVGTLWEGKGPQVAIQALGQLLRKRGLPKLHLDFFGKGTPGFMEYLRDHVKKAGVEDHVTFHGFVDRQDLPEIQRNHDILLFPSIWDEPFAAVPIEAMACGMAVIATTAGGTPEAIEEGRTGLLIPPNDPSAMSAAMEGLIRDPQRRLHLGQEGALAAREKYDFHTYIARLERRYSELAQRSK
ncbi:MAG: glycosyltransferase family 4 protein [Acidobacteriia bacterium]|nr:glycosyltransferase family 4 protein [Terriglobia bacterium]